MTATLEIVSPGALATIQDLGRVGWRRFGVPRAGVLDPALLRIANTLVGNAEDAAAIEFFVAGPTLKAVDGPLQLGFAGDFAVTLQRASGERRQLDAWRSVTLQPGEALRIGSPRTARGGVVAVRGLAVPAVLGSAATYTRARLGGLGGRSLATGDRLQAASLPLHDGAPPPDRRLPRPPAADGSAIRVVPGPQADHFDAAAMAAFFAAEYRVSADADRMGVRLQGQALLHNARGAEIVTDATVPGSIQVPGNGQPIVLLADGQTAGGYPKIATVISADLPRLALAPVGSSLRFAPVTVAQAEALAREREAALRRLLATIEALAMDGDIDLSALYAANLVSGMIDASN
ncbi:MAG: biotin-dependent carboxyltransferase family protein [Burkholderiaceae bacterium]|nr:biotin-dependent carboxyltransferase family protein [Burkholderiaceae bacterium]